MNFTNIDEISSEFKLYTSNHMDKIDVGIFRPFLGVSEGSFDSVISILEERVVRFKWILSPDLVEFAW